MTTALIARARYTYGTGANLRRLQPGDRFEASDKDARLLCTMRKAEVDELAAAKPARAPKSKQPKKQKKRGYNRRDMRPES